MFQPVGVKTLLQMRPPLPERPSTDSAKAVCRRDSSEDVFRPPTAPPTLGSREVYEPRAVSSQDAANEDMLNPVDPVQDLGSLVQEASSMLHQLQSGWHEERQSEIDQLWSQCEAEYGFVLPRDAPGTPALGSLRARAGYGAAGLLGSLGNGTLIEPCIEANPVNSPTEAEVEADLATEAAQRDLEAARERRKRIEAMLATKSEQASVLKQRVTTETEADARRLESLRMEVERLRAKADTLSSTDASPSRSNEDADEEAVPIAPPTPAAAAAIRSVDLARPELEALDEWMEDIRVLSSEGALRRDQGRVKAVASPMRVRNASAASSRSPRSGPSTPSSPSKKEMARLAEQRALEWASGQSPRPTPGQATPSRSPKSPSRSARGGLLGGGSNLPTTPEQPLASTDGPSAVERELDDILKELDEIDRIHDDVCMLAHS